MDEWQYEMANKVTDAARDKQLEELRESMPTGEGPEFCETCEDDMHPVRRAHGYNLCVTCQEMRESNQKQEARGL